MLTFKSDQQAVKGSTVEERYEELDDQIPTPDVILASNLVQYVPQSWIDWMYDAENAMIPYIETVLLVLEAWPVLFMCNILSATEYTSFNEIEIELDCFNSAFSDFKILWNDN